MLSLFLKLLLAHILADFLWQPNSWIADKLQKKERSPRLYLHAALHLLLMFLFTGFTIKLLPALLFITLVHFVTDLNKLYLHKKYNAGLLFAADQLIHLSVLAAVSWCIVPTAFDLSWLQSNKVALFIIALLMLTYVTAIIIKVAIARWRVDDASLTEAGKYIGMGERLLIFFFVVSNHWEGVGFLLAAKSIFRFGDLNKDNDRKLTEYVMIGTLLSFGIALIISVLYVKLLRFV